MYILKLHSLLLYELFYFYFLINKRTLKRGCLRFYYSKTLLYFSSFIIIIIIIRNISKHYKNIKHHDWMCGYISSCYTAYDHNKSLMHIDDALVSAIVLVARITRMLLSILRSWVSLISLKNYFTAKISIFSFIYWNKYCNIKYITAKFRNHTPIIMPYATNFSKLLAGFLFFPLE